MDKAAYLVLGIESQSQIEYAMPVRNMVYDSLEYDRQIKESGNRRGDFLKPVITLVLYLGADHWDAPKSLYELFPPLDESIKPFVNDYRIYILEPAALNDDDYNKFKTDLGKIMDFIKCSNNKVAMRALLDSGKMKGLSEEGCLFLREVTHTKLNIKNEEEEDAVCKAVDDLVDEGRQQGHTAGFAEGHASGMIEGRREERMNAIKRMQEILKMTAEQAMELLGIPKEDQTDYLCL